MNGKKDLRVGSMYSGQPTKRLESFRIKEKIRTIANLSPILRKK